MSEKITFSVFDPIRFDVPAQCTICLSRPPAFHYECSVDEGTRQSPTKGFTCASCAVILLEQLQQAELRAWAEEEASLKAEGQDASDLATAGERR